MGQRLSLICRADRLHEQFKRDGAMDVLEETITLRRTVLDLTPLGHPARRPYLISLADSVYEWFREKGAKEVLDEVVTLWRNVLGLTPPGNPDRRSTLVNLADRLTSGSGKLVPWRIYRRLSHSDELH